MSIIHQRGPVLRIKQLTKVVQGIATSAYGPLTAITKGAGGPADDILQGLAKKYAVSTGEISLRWCIDQDIVAITTSGKEQRLSDYLRAMTFKLTPKEIEQVSFKIEKSAIWCLISCAD